MRPALKGTLPGSVALLLLLGLACEPQEGSRSGGRGETREAANDTTAGPPDLAGVTIVKERWISTWDTTSNLDSPATWIGEEGAWVVSTAKGTHDLWVHDASTGRLIHRMGSQGAALGEFNYPNGIAILGDLLLVVERDNHRVQVLALPAFEPLGTFGDTELERPYGIALFADAQGVLQVYVTDDYGNEEDPPEGQDPSGDLTRRVRHYAVQVKDGTVDGRWVNTFGEAEGPGALLVVESIQVDPDQDLLLIADEHRLELEAYGLDGRYRERTVGSGLYRHGDPEGIMLYRCGTEGYWILTDQGEARTVFHLLDRRTFEPLGSFAGEVTANTDGIWLDQRLIPGLGEGALFALHDDGGLAAFAWDDVASAMELRRGCRP